MEMATLDSICSRISSSGTPPRKSAEYFAAGSDGHLWVKSKELLDGSISDTEETITDEGLNNSAAKFFPAHSVLIAMYGANVGQLGWLRKPATVNQAICGLVVDERKADWRFVFYAVWENRGHLTVQAQGAAQQNVNQDMIRQFVVPLPELSQQRRIADILSAYDDLIENNLRRIRILEEMARALYREWFVEFRFPGFAETSIVSSDFGRDPKTWKVLPLRAITTKIGSGATPRGGKEAYKQTGIRLIRSMNVYNDRFDHNDLAFIDETQAAELGNVIVQEQDILLNITGASVARCCMVPSYLLPARVNQHVAIIRVDDKAANALYVLDTINSEYCKESLLTLSQGGATREALTKDAIGNFEILVPPPEIRLRYSALVRPLFEQREILDLQTANLRRTRDLLLPRLMSGQATLDEAIA